MYSHFDSNIWVTPFGFIFIVAILTAWAYTRRNATVSGIDASHIDLLMPIAVIVGIAGGTVVAMFIPMDHKVAGEMMNYGIRLRLFGMLATGAVAIGGSHAGIYTIPSPGGWNWLGHTDQPLFDPSRKGTDAFALQPGDHLQFIPKA